MSARTEMDLVDRAERAIGLVKEAVQEAREIAELAKASSAAAWKEWERSMDRTKRHVGMATDAVLQTERFRFTVAAAASERASDAHFAVYCAAESLQGSVEHMEKNAKFVASQAVIFVSGEAESAQYAFRDAEQAEASAKSAEEAVAAWGGDVGGPD